MTHVFIVDETTFNIHLQYLFAGTGYANNEPQLNSSTTAKYEAEKTLTGMIADISKVRKGDLILFYVMGCKKLFGVFEVESLPFFNDYKTDYLGNNLGKYLPFRVKIKSNQVYPKGITEQQALDDISSIDHPYQMCWSLIYRKLTGMRGCSFVTDYEFDKLLEFIKAINNNTTIKSTDLCYNASTQSITPSATHHNYTGRTNSNLNINNRLFNVSGAFEAHLQAYITQNYDKSPLSSLLLPVQYNKLWIGNEVICSVGERRIDIMIILETQNDILIRVIELKDEKPKDEIVNKQLPWYIKWVDQYIAPNYKSANKAIKIVPTIIAAPYKRSCPGKINFDKAITNYNSTQVVQLTNSHIEPIEYIVFNIQNNSISFTRII